MKLRTSCLSTILALLAVATFASAGTVSVTGVYPATVNTTCPPFFQAEPGPPGTLLDYNDACAPAQNLFQLTGSAQPQPPGVLSFAQFNPGVNAPADAILTGVTIYINTYAKTDLTVTNLTSNGAGGNTTRNGGSTAPRVQNFLSFTTSGSDNGTDFFAAQLTGPRFCYGNYVKTNATNGNATAFLCNPGSGPAGVDDPNGSSSSVTAGKLLPGGDPNTASDETFDVRQWENMVTWTPTNSLVGTGGGYHVTSNNAITGFSDIIPIQNLAGTTGTVDSLGGSAGCDTTGICSFAPGDATFLGTGNFSIYYQASGNVAFDNGTGISLNPQFVGAGVALRIVYQYTETSTPEPGSLLLLGSGLSVVAGFIRRRKAGRS